LTYAQGDGVRDNRNASEGGGLGVGVSGPDEHRLGFQGVDELTRGFAKGGESIHEAREGLWRQGSQENLCIVRVVHGDIPNALDGDAQQRLCPEPGSKRLCHVEVKERGEWASLSDTRVPCVLAGLHAVDVSASHRVVKQKTSPADHATRCAHGFHDPEDELPIHRIIGLGDVNVDVGATEVVADHDMWKEGGEVDVVAYEAVGEVG
jgi:hypothetical protein